jgi:hypothetical protein
MRRIFPIGLLFLIIPALWLAPLLPAPNAFPFAPNALYSDLAITHWTNALVVHRSILADGEVPLWNAMLLGGTPLVGDPLSGLYYPPLWLAAVVPEPWTFNLILYLHLALAGLGVYTLARAEGGSRAAALLAGFAFCGSAKLVAHIAAGHLTLICAVAWTPWLFLAARRARQTGVRQAALAGALAGFIFLADPRWALPAGVAALAYAFVAEPFPSFKEVWRTGAVGLFFAGGIGAVLAVPMYSLVSFSTRSALAASDNLTLSLPLRALFGFFIPQTGGSLEWVIYSGALVFLLAVLGVFVRPRPSPNESDPPTPPGRRGSVWFWPCLLALAVVFSLGDSTPAYPVLTQVIPGLDWLRVPPRWMFLAGLALTMLAVRGWDAIAVHAEPGWFAKAIFGVAAAGAATACAAWGMGLPQPLLFAGGVWCASGLALWWILVFRPREILAAGVLIAMVCMDLAIADGRIIQPRSLTEVLSTDHGSIAQSLAHMPDGFRVYSPSYSIPQESSVFLGWRAIHGVSPLILKSTQAMVLSAAGIPSSAYSVTLPPFASGDPAVANRDAAPDARAMGLLNVRYLVSAFPITGLGWISMPAAAGSFLYEDAFAYPRLWIAENSVAWQTPLTGRAARIETETANRLRISAVGPGELILSDAMYPGWQATVDDAPVPVETAGGWWRAVRMDAGAHVIEMRFAPAAQYLGLAITLFAMALLAGVMRWAK